MIDAIPKQAELGPKTESDQKRIDEFLHRLTELSCEFGIMIARDSNGKPVVVFMEPEDYSFCYGLNSSDELIQI